MSQTQRSGEIANRQRNMGDRQIAIGGEFELSNCVRDGAQKRLTNFLFFGKRIRKSLRQSNPQFHVSLLEAVLIVLADRAERKPVPITHAHVRRSRLELWPRFVRRRAIEGYILTARLVGRRGLHGYARLTGASVRGALTGLTRHNGITEGNLLLREVNYSLVRAHRA